MGNSESRIQQRNIKQNCFKLHQDLTRLHDHPNSENLKKFTTNVDLLKDQIYSYLQSHPERHVEFRSLLKVLRHHDFDSIKGPFDMPFKDSIARLLDSLDEALDKLEEPTFIDNIIKELGKLFTAIYNFFGNVCKQLTN